MDKGLADFINGNVNAAKIEVIISREKKQNGQQYIYIKPIGEELTVFEFWHNPKKQNKNPPKHIGGRKPYIMLMVDEVERLKKDGVENVEEMIGFLVCLGKNIEWGTGKVINKRSKKPLKYTDLQKVFTCGKRKLDRILADLKQYGLLSNTQEGYFISTKFIKKGANRNGY